MRRRFFFLLLILATSAQPSRPAASVEPKWTDAQLADFSLGIVRGRVERTYAAHDPANQLIYTYVEISVRTVLKGQLPDVLVIKQMGGQVGNLLLSVVDAPRFTTGEDVLLFLEMRPRDGSLYTVASSQGKWIVESGSDGRESLRRGEEVRHMSAMRELITGRPSGPSRAQAANPNPDDARARFDADVPSFTLPPEPWPPFRFHSSDNGATLPVDTEPLGQYGLVGSGRSETGRAAQIWSGAGARLALSLGLEQSRVCAGTAFPSGRIQVSYRDPCGEIDNLGGTIAIGGAWVDVNDRRTVNGVSFGNARGGFIVNNDSAWAQRHLRRSRCFQDIQTHELGHVIGLGHSPLTGAIMHADAHNLDSCKPPEPVAVSWSVPTTFSRVRLGSCEYNAVHVDVQVTGTLSDESFTGELRFPTFPITPRTGWPVHCNNRQSVTASSLSVTASRVATGAAFYNYEEAAPGRNPFGSESGQRRWGFQFFFCDPLQARQCDPTFVWDARVKIGLYFFFEDPAYTEAVSLRGDFEGPSLVPATDAPAFAGNGLGPDDVAGARFVYPGSGLAAPSQLTATVSAGVVTLRWLAPSPAPASYVVEVGTQPGAANLVAANVGLATQASGALAPGTYYARVRAVHAAGTSPPSPDVSFTIGSATLPAPTGLAAQVNNRQVSLTWIGVTGASSYVVEAGSAPGLTNLANVDVGNMTGVSASVAAGRYYARVRARNASGTSDASTEITFVAGGCEAPPPAPRTVSGRVVGTTAFVDWSESPGAINYALRAGSTETSSDLFDGYVGNRTAISAQVPTGFRAYVRLFAANPCGVSAATPVLFIQ